MKKIAILLLSIVAMSYGVSAQQENIKRVEIKHKGVNEIESSLPVLLRFVDGEDGDIEIKYPASVEEFITVGFDENSDILIIKANGKDLPRKFEDAVNEKQPILVNICASSIKSILNTSDMSIHFNRIEQAEALDIINNLTLTISGEELVATDKFQIYNTGTMTCRIKKMSSECIFATNNMGYLHIEGVAEANHIEYNSVGIDSLDLDVRCAKLQIATTGSGLIKCKGEADDVIVASMGNTTIRLNELNR